MTLNRPEKNFDRFFGGLGEVLEVLDDEANEDCLGLEGRDMSEGGDRGEGQKLELSGEEGVVDAVDRDNPVDAEPTDSVSHDLVRYDSLGSLLGCVGIKDAIMSAPTWEGPPTVDQSHCGEWVSEELGEMGAP